MNKTWSVIKKYKKTSILILVVLIFGGWYYYSKASGGTVTTYTVRPVALGMIKTTVTGAGQVSSSQEITVNPQVSGTVTSVLVKNGDVVQKGQVLATLDSTNAGYSLENAKISLAKLESSNPISEASNQNSVTSAQTSLNQSYTSAFNTLTSTYSDITPILNSLNSLYYANTSAYFTDSNLAAQGYSTTALQYKQTAGQLLDQAKQLASDFRSTYAAATVNSTSTIEADLTQENAIVQKLLQALQNTSIAINYVISNTQKQNQNQTMSSDQANVSSWIGTVNQDSSSVSNAISSIDSNARSLSQAVATLNQTQTTSNPLDLESAQLSLTQAQNTFDEYTIRAPISGVIGDVTLKVGDNAGASSVVATVFTKSYISNIVLNEVDAAKITVGQPVEVTFNALAGVTATGTVTDVDTIGTVSQGVVSYTDVISFDSSSPDIKIGMSINAVITSSEKDNVIVVPNSALKTLGTRQYVLEPAAGQTGPSVTQVTQKFIQTGLSDDTNTEITSGLSVGDMIVTKTTVGTATKSTQASLLGSLTGRGAGGTAAAAGATRTGNFGGGAGFTGGARGGTGAAAGR